MKNSCKISAEMIESIIIRWERMLDDFVNEYIFAEEELDELYFSILIKDTYNYVCSAVPESPDSALNEWQQYIKIHSYVVAYANQKTVEGDDDITLPFDASKLVAREVAEPFTKSKQQWFNNNLQGIINIDVDEVSDEYLEEHDGIITVPYDINKGDLSPLIEALESCDSF